VFHDCSKSRYNPLWPFHILLLDNRIITLFASYSSLHERLPIF
jgi:hypothetical protein